jgi:hypothetical protein
MIEKHNGFSKQAMVMSYPTKLGTLLGKIMGLFWHFAAMQELLQFRTNPRFWLWVELCLEVDITAMLTFLM